MRPKSKSLKVFANRLALSAMAVFSVGALAAAEWKVDIVDTSGSGQFSSMKIDTKGNVHVAYIPDIQSHPLKYAFWDKNVERWFTMGITGAASFCSLALDSQQRPHISYADQGVARGAKLRHAYWDGTTWKTQVVSPLTDAVVGYYTSVALDSHDNPYFSYYDYEGPAGIGFVLRMRSVFWTGSYWGVHMVDRQPGSGKFNSIAVDSQGRPHIAYANVKAEFMSLRYASWDGSTWKSEVLEGATEAVGIWSTALLLDEKDNPHIAYTDVSKRLVKYATRKNGQWQIDVVDRIRQEAYPDRNGIALDDQGNPYVSYYDAGQGILKVAFRKNGKWYSEVVARDYAGFTSSLQIHDGMLWVSYADDEGGTFQVARRPLEDLPVTSAAASAGMAKPALK